MRRWTVLASLMVLCVMAGQAATVEVKLPKMAVRAGKTFEVSIAVSDVSKLDLLGVDFTLTYDPTLVAATGIESKKTLTDGWSSANKVGSGEIRVSTANARAAAGKGTLLKVMFKANRRVSGATDLKFTKLRFNEDQIPVTANVGRIKIRPREDCNDDDRIDIADLILAARHIGSRVLDDTPEQNYDVNEDGEISIVDLIFISRRLGETVNVDE